MQQRYFTLISIVSLCLAILAVYVIAWIIQSNLLLNWDVSWFLYGTQKILLNGGTYSKDFIEYNPPLILYLSYLPVAISHKVPISIVILFRVYIFLLVTLSLGMCYYLIQSIFCKNRLLGFLFFLLIALVLLILPFIDFGQREHLFLILTMPYLLCVVARLDNHSINAYLGLFIGICAGIGFAIKIHFLLMWILVELYFTLQKRQWNASLRIETITIISIWIGYLLSSLWLYPDYFSIVLPLLTQVYHNGYSDDSWITTLFHPSVYFCLITCVLYIFQYNKYPYKNLNSVLFFAMSGCLLFYIIQRTTYFYHFYPMVALATLLTMLTLSSFYFQPAMRLKDGLFILLLGILIYIYEFSGLKYSYDYGVTYTKNYSHLITYLRQNMQHKSIYVITSSHEQIFPIYQYADVRYFSRMNSVLIMFDGARQIQLIKHDNTLSPQQKKNENYFMNIISTEIKNNKPDFIFVDVRKYKPFFLVQSFDYVKYFLKYSSFQAVWKDYSYLTTIEQSPINGYQFQVYQRKNRG